MRLIAEGTERLDRFLARLLPEHSRSRLAKLIDAGGVRVDGIDRKASFGLRTGMEVDLGELVPTPPHDLTPADIPLDLLYEDEALLVVNKPRGMPSHPSPGQTRPTLVNALLARSHSLSSESGAFRPGIVHRLDKETTGLMVVAKNDSVHRHLQLQIKEKRADRRYVGLAWGTFDQERFSIDAPLARNPRNRLQMKVLDGGKHAITHFKVLKSYPPGTLIAARLETGRTHQIRAHLTWNGHPLRGDTIYSTSPWNEGPLQLHAAFLAFDHPLSGERHAYFCPPPHDFLESGVERASLEDW